jgi:hypothetical protein
MKVRSLSRRPPPSKWPTLTTACEHPARITGRGRFRSLGSTESLHTLHTPHTRTPASSLPTAFTHRGSCYFHSSSPGVAELADAADSKN